MLTIELLVTNEGLIDEPGWPIRIGVPIPESVVHSVDELALLDGAGADIGADMEPLSVWSDGSLRWVLASFLGASRAGAEQKLLFVQRIRERAHTNRPVAGRPALFKSRASEALPVLSGETGSDEHPLVDARLVLGLDGEREVSFHTDQPMDAAETSSASSAMLCGDWITCHGSSGRESLSVRAEVNAYSEATIFRIGVEVHNPAPALHPDGFWDLGDPNSCRFKRLELQLQLLQDETIDLELIRSLTPHALGDEDFVLYQGGSGGPQYNCDTHVNASGEVPVSVPGYQLLHNGECVVEGDRAEPEVLLSSGWRVSKERFWQECPSAISRDGSRLLISLLPASWPDLFELQPGERKTFVVWLRKDPHRNLTCHSSLRCRVAPTAYFNAHVFPTFGCRDSSAKSTLDELVQAGLDQSTGFRAKREWTDEYGWRNFGDLVADHETWGLDVDGVFTSHFNNQYDPIYGFSRQYALQGDARWAELLGDLALHVLDIDLYSTSRDRPEYNRGLFWHTDHYQKAYTCSHRTYSREHAAAGSMGGGPGGEHCYTTGLKLFHLMTGDRRARDAVLSLADWVKVFYDGSGTALEQLQKLLRSQLKELGRSIAGKPIDQHTLALHRGIGNYLVAQLDAFELDRDHTRLVVADSVVRRTATSRDDLDQRNFDDIENTWFYTIYLQALERYLDVKRVEQEFDKTFDEARKTLIHYARWMADNESPYLDNPDRLEYVNHTWAAQDIRKALVLLAAYRYSPEPETALLEAARRFIRYVEDELKDEPTLYYTRVLAILMQNHGVGRVLDYEPERYQLPALRPEFEKPQRSWHTVLGEIRHGWGCVIVEFSLRREWTWLGPRLRGLRRGVR